MTEAIERPAPAMEEKLLSMMADQQEEFSKFRENVNARLANIERARSRKREWPSFDFEMIAGLALLFFVGMILTRVLLAALASRTKEENAYGHAQVSGS